MTLEAMKGNEKQKVEEKMPMRNWQEEDDEEVHYRSTQAKDAVDTNQVKQEWSQTRMKMTQTTKQKSSNTKKTDQAQDQDDQDDMTENRQCNA